MIVMPLFVIFPPPELAEKEEVRDGDLEKGDLEEGELKLDAGELEGPGRDVFAIPPNKER